jgi:hypothetical protein
VLDQLSSDALAPSVRLDEQAVKLLVTVATRRRSE